MIEPYRVIDLLNRYDELLEIALNAYHNGIFGFATLAALREEKKYLTKELIEHGCRSEN